MGALKLAKVNYFGCYCSSIGSFFKRFSLRRKNKAKDADPEAEKALLNGSRSRSTHSNLMHGGQEMAILDSRNNNKADLSSLSVDSKRLPQGADPIGHRLSNSGKTTRPSKQDRHLQHHQPGR